VSTLQASSGGGFSRPIRNGSAGRALARGVVTGYLSLVVLLPLAAVAWHADDGGFTAFRHAVTKPDAFASLELTVGISLAVVALNAVTGTLIAWVLVRDHFPGKGVVNALIDLPFALPTIVAGLVLLQLYGPKSPIHVNLGYSRAGVALALAFVTLPFVVRAVQPVLEELDLEQEEAATSLGANGLTTFRRIILPSLVPAIGAGVSLGFARAIGEFGATVLISGNIPFKTEVAAVHIAGQIESGDLHGATAVSVVLLALSMAVLTVVTVIHRRGERRGR
jgi:sulfate transport system permease protein